MSEISGYGTAVVSSFGWGRQETESEGAKKPQLQQQQQLEMSASREAGQRQEHGAIQGVKDRLDRRLIEPLGKLEPLDAYRTDDPEALAKAVERMEEFINRVGRDLQFSLDDRTGKTVVTVYVRGTEDVVRQIPPDEMLALAARMKEAQGILFNEQA